MIFFTIPLTTEPSSRFEISSSLSSLFSDSKTAFLETTTLFLFLSILIKINSKSLPSRYVVSLTGLTSTKEPGRKALISAKLIS